MDPSGSYALPDAQFWHEEDSIYHEYRIAPRNPDNILCVIAEGTTYLHDMCSGLRVGARLPFRRRSAGPLLFGCLVGVVVRLKGFLNFSGPSALACCACA